MNKVRYGIIEETYVLDNIRRTSYGVAAYEDLGKEGIYAVVMQIGDICSDREKLLTFIESCNQLDLSLIHLRDAVDDFLAE